ncbi:lactate utilization protein [Pseudaminobacter sp. 19-2017]|uniref:Lactate utilization protein n=1 Tax=Pseudaminobacter soli (ex Zhang et al. 2022) TaxID=2831468 RepID=A0A942DX01_9HYPH|nr:lactate utilization protein [Pseudaminobacter soli]MBS3648427.1 lactate utilization protein [Pseudaminobacter soli]
MSARDAILGKIRRSLGADASDPARRAAVTSRLELAPLGVIPARGQLPQAERVALFCTMAKKLLASVERVSGYDAVPETVAGYLRNNNLPAAVRMGADERLSSMPWVEQRALEISRGPSDGDDAVGVSHAGSGVAETGTLVLTSGGDNPTTINFLPDHHIVVVSAADIEGDLESALAKIRERYGKGEMPRTVNLISGPSRSGDIEQKLILGAHGPRALHIIVVDEPGVS